MTGLKLISSVAAMVLAIGFYYPYIRDILRKKTQPHIYSWLIWLITQGTALAGMWYGGGGFGALNILIGWIIVFGVFVLSFWFGTRNITLGDMVVLVMALFTIVVWWMMHAPVFAVLLAAGIYMLGYIPTYRKSYEDPWSETYLYWVGMMVSEFLLLFSLKEYNFLTTSYVAIVCVANTAMVVLLTVRRRRILQPLQVTLPLP